MIWALGEARRFACKLSTCDYISELLREDEAKGSAEELGGHSAQTVLRAQPAFAVFELNRMRWT